MPTPHDTAKSGSHEHGAGWHVFIGDEHIADLDWLRDEDLCYGYFWFVLNAFTTDSGKLAYALSRTSSRLPDDQVFLINRATGGILADDHFFADLRDDANVRLRAFGNGRVPFFLKAQ